MARFAVVGLVALVACAAPRKAAPPPPPPVGAAPLAAPRDEERQREDRAPDPVAVGGEGDDGTSADPCEGGEVTGGDVLGKGGVGIGGTGYGRGSGSLGGKPANKPAVGVGTPSHTGQLDKDIIRRVIKANVGKIRACYEKELMKDPNAQGTVTAKFVIGPTGTVIASAATGISAAIEACVADAVKQLQFPAPTGGGSVSVSYPFTFKPAGS